MIKCRICGGLFKQLQIHLKYKHNMTGEEYKKKYSIKHVICKILRRSISKKISKRNIGKQYSLGNKQSKEQIEKHRKFMLGKKYAKGSRRTEKYKRDKRKVTLKLWKDKILTEKKCCNRRCKWFPVKNYIGRIIDVRGTYEKKFSEILTKLGIRWGKYVGKGFKYKLDGKEKRYYPDFYLKDYKWYVEIKGWIRKDNREKVKEKKRMMVERSKRKGFKYNMVFFKDIERLEFKGVNNGS